MCVLIASGRLPSEIKITSVSLPARAVMSAAAWRAAVGRGNSPTTNVCRMAASGDAASVVPAFRAATDWDLGGFRDRRLGIGDITGPQDHFVKC